MLCQSAAACTCCFAAKMATHMLGLIVSWLQSAALDCILPHSNAGLPLAVARTLVQLAIPLIILVVFCTAWVAMYTFAWWCCEETAESKGPEWLSKRLKLTCYSVLGYFYSSLTQASLGVFACYPIDHPIPSGTLYQSFLEVSKQ